MKRVGAGIVCGGRIGAFGFLAGPFAGIISTVAGALTGAIVGMCLGARQCRKLDRIPDYIYLERGLNAYNDKTNEKKRELDYVSCKIDNSQFNDLADEQFKEKQKELDNQLTAVTEELEQHRDKLKNCRESLSIKFEDVMRIQRDIDSVNSRILSLKSQQTYYQLSRSYTVLNNKRRYAVYSGANSFALSKKINSLESKRSNLAGR